MSVAASKELVRGITERVWNARELDRIPDFYAADYVADYRPYAPLREGHAAVRGMVERAWGALPDYHEELRGLVAEGDRVVARLTISGTQRGRWASSRRRDAGSSSTRSSSSRFATARSLASGGIADNVTALRQLGVLPSPPP